VGDDEEQEESSFQKYSDKSILSLVKWGGVVGKTNIRLQILSQKLTVYDSDAFPMLPNIFI